MMKRSGVLLAMMLVSVCVSPASAQQEEREKGEMMAILRPGMYVKLQAVPNTAAWDVYAFPADQQPEGGPSLVTVVGKDYFGVRTDNANVYIPKHAIRRITTPVENPLNARVSAKFNRTPLQEFIAEISKQIGAEILIDADALKFSGYTRNMPQTVAADQVPAKQLLANMLAQYPEMVLAASGKNFILTTRPFADKNQQPILDLDIETVPRPQ